MSIQLSAVLNSCCSVIVQMHSFNIAVVKGVASPSNVHCSLSMLMAAQQRVRNANTASEEDASLIACLLACAVTGNANGV